MRPGKALVSAPASPVVHAPTASASASASETCRLSGPDHGVRNRFELDPEVIWSCSKIMCALQNAGPLAAANLCLSGLLASQRGLWVEGGDLRADLGWPCPRPPSRLRPQPLNNYQLSSRWTPSPPDWPAGGTIHV